ncbi:hypothetical protein MBM_05430 [Drepanopeziza brunnea f. sp. 'multigermtubi' MB_m1]|uniref:Uncharacterized protein n=1 Tax=Marssonina brunnea f. sp. multigermtubi (strain MB_m1) TaxID=1072389 RepID=K1WSY3_MARBU|nr:uncharacterized protein MBM_05430 [Drepanopeziza brunnea f. sp. 'multigermtubi' MB_m1]EKD16136.1 hypothetical protein MBM_05430 [Drepanopeziza brunnea f. sp. 'multigermtubi' MB_m1]
MLRHARAGDMKRHLPTQGFSYSQLLHCSQSVRYRDISLILYPSSDASWWSDKRDSAPAAIVELQDDLAKTLFAIDQVHFLETWLWPYAVEVNERAPSYGKGILQKGAALKLYASDIDALYQTLPEERRRPDSGPESP